MLLNSLNESPACTLPPSKLITGLNASRTPQINSLWQRSPAQASGKFHFLSDVVPWNVRKFPCITHPWEGHHHHTSHFLAALPAKASRHVAEGAHSLSLPLPEAARGAVSREERRGDVSFRNKTTTAKEAHCFVQKSPRDKTYPFPLMAT